MNGAHFVAFSTEDSLEVAVDLPKITETIDIPISMTEAEVVEDTTDLIFTTEKRTMC